MYERSDMARIFCGEIEWRGSNEVIVPYNDVFVIQGGQTFTIVLQKKRTPLGTLDTTKGIVRVYNFYEISPQSRKMPVEVLEVNLICAGFGQYVKHKIAGIHLS